MYLELFCHGEYEPFKKILRIIAGTDTGSFIDLCSHTASMTKSLPFKRKVFVDVDQHVIPEGEMIATSVLGDHPIFNERFDVAYCLDGIEHLHKPEGYALMARMEKISKRQVVFTPLGDYCVNPSDEHPHSHKSGWLPEDVKGWACIVCPNWHPSLGLGAWFFFKTPNLEAEFERIKREIKADPFYKAV